LQKKGPACGEDASGNAGAFDPVRAVAEDKQSKEETGEHARVERY
jgi:hypothetical protein